MKPYARVLCLAMLSTAALLSAASAMAEGPTTSIGTEYLMTMYLPALRNFPSGALVANAPTPYAQSPLSWTSPVFTRTELPPDPTMLFQT